MGENRRGTRHPRFVTVPPQPGLTFPNYPNFCAATAEFPPGMSSWGAWVGRWLFVVGFFVVFLLFFFQLPTKIAALVRLSKQHWLAQETYDRPASGEPCDVSTEGGRA